MIDEEAKEIIKQGYRAALGEKHIENLRWHLRNETLVLCGEPFKTLPYCNGEGAG